MAADPFHVGRFASVDPGAIKTARLVQLYFPGQPGDQDVTSAEGIKAGKDVYQMQAAFVSSYFR